jgi:hypothetical protein
MSFFTGTNVAGMGGGLLGFIGQQQTNQKNWDIAQAANAASAEQAAAQMAFQERMRKTQYQTAVEDMKSAGLNPMLAYTQGGAGTPTGAMGSVSTATMKNALGAGVTGYQQMSMNEADIDLKKATTTGTTAATLKTEADTIRTAAEIGNILQTTKMNTEQTRNLQEMLLKLQQEIVNLRATHDLTTAQTAKTKAEEKNVTANVAPSTDPFWYRDFKRVMKHPKLLIPFGGKK